MKFSICIPTHRVDWRLENTLKSLEMLDYPREDYEICIFLNGAPEDSKTPKADLVVGTLSALGPSEAKNQAIKLADHEWVILVDSDDFLVPSALNHYKSFVEKNSRAVLGCELSVINFLGPAGTKEAYFPDTIENYRKFFNQTVSTMAETAACGRPILFKKSQFLPFDSSFSFAEERKLALDYWKARHPVHILGTSTYVYNWNENGVTGGMSLGEMPPEERQGLERFTEWVKNQRKDPNAFADENFYVPGKEDCEAIHKFLDWENTCSKQSKVETTSPES